MKKRMIFILIVLFLIPSVLAIETTLKQEYEPGETLITEISGNFIDTIKPSDIQFYSGRVYIPLIYNIGKISDKYYLYALLPTKERDYTLVIKDAHYYELGQEKSEDLKFDFSVSGNTSLFSVNPGFIITNKDFNIKAESKIKTITLASKFLNSTKEFSISPGKTKTISFSISSIEQSKTTTLILKTENQTYEIPVLIFPKESTATKTNDLRFFKSILNFTVLKNQEFEFEITLLNTGQEEIQDIQINYSGLEDAIYVTPEKIEVLEAGSLKPLRISINSNKTGIVEGKIAALSEDQTQSAEILLFLITTENQEEYNHFLDDADIIEQDSCSDLGGQFCEDNEECDGTNKLTIDGLCCVGSCEEKEESNLGTIITVILIIVVISIIAFFVYKKFKIRKKTTKEVLGEKSKSYEEKIKPEIKEVRNSLEKS